MPSRLSMLKKGGVALVAFIITMVLLWVTVPRYFSAPNDYLTRYGGDGVKNVYVVAYHVKYDTTRHFSGMLYPFGDDVLFTDNILLSTFLQQLQHYLPMTADYTAAVLNWCFLISIALGVVCIVLLLLEWQVHPLFAVTAAIPIMFLSPQLPRVFGHYSLSYLFFLPLLWYSITKAYSELKPGFWIVLLVLIQPVFTFTHSYFLAMLLLMQLGYVVVYWFINRSQNSVDWKRVMLVLSTLIPLLVSYVIAAYCTGKQTDRPLVPWGFESSCSQPYDIFLPAYHGFERYLPAGLAKGDINREGYGYIGLAAIILLILLIVEWVRYRFSKPSVTNSIDQPTTVFFITVLKQQRAFLILLGVAVLFLLVAFGFPFFGPLIKVREHLPIFPQFRSVGRFTWFFYYAINLVVAYLVYAKFNQLIARGKKLKAWIWVLVYFGLIYNEANANIYHLKALIYSIPQENRVTRLHHDKYNGITDTTYQAILTLPVVAVGTDKVGQFPSVPLMEAAMELSYCKHLPIINGQMTRNSLQEQLLQYQLAGNLVMTKQLFAYLPNRKPILLVVDTFLCGLEERALLANATFIQTIDQHAYYSLALPKFQLPDSILAKRVAQATEFNSAKSGWMNALFWQTASANTSTVEALFGGGNWFKKRDTMVLYDASFPASISDSMFEVSVWCYQDIRHFGSANLQVFVSPSEGVPEKHETSSGRSYDCFKGWSRAAVVVKVKPNKCRLKIVVQDEYCTAAGLMIRPLNRDFVTTINKQMWLNNYPIQLNHEKLRF